jgi:hypothetical protein
VGTQFARRWRAFFTLLERLHGLNPEKPEHLWLLHLLFLDDLNQDCNAFQDEWNHHPISGKQTRGQAPTVCTCNISPYCSHLTLHLRWQDIRFISRAQHGVEEDHAGVDPAILNRYYGVEGDTQHRPTGQTGAGHPPDKELDNLIADGQQSDIRHAAIEVPSERCPFTAEGEALFRQMLREIQEVNQIPIGFGVAPNEWSSANYPTHEFIQVGGRKKVMMALPFQDWWPRAVRWAQGYELMIKLMVELNM